MATAGYATLDVIPSVKGMRAKLEQQTGRDFAAAGRRGGEQFGDAAGKSAAGRFKSRFGSVGRDVFAPLAGLAAGAVVVDLFKDAISGASDLAESGNKISVIFGDAAGEVQAFADKGAKSLGQTKLAVLNAAGSFGTFGKAAGLSGSELAGFSTKLAGLSTDMASFFNTSPEQAIEAIGAALRGEAEPIRAYGVLLDDATLRQEALRQGLIQTTKQALTPQQKVLAAYQVILQQTSDAQGDFERTSDGLANQQRILTAQWSEMKTELGSKLLPVATETVKVFNDGVLPAMEGVGGVAADAARGFAGLPGPVKAATAALVAFRLAQVTGIGVGVSNALSSTSKGLDSVRLRAMLAADSYRALRSGQLEIINNSGKFTPAVGRMSASLGALKTAGAGAGAGLKRGLSGALGLVGGPWGAAFIAGTALVAKFWSEHQQAKARVEELTESLDKQTGAVTANTREMVAKQLADTGVLGAAERLGVSLELVTDAALGQKDAMAALSAQIRGRGQLDDKAAADAIKVKGAIDGTNGSLKDAAANHRLLAAAMGTSAAAANGSVDATDRMAGATGEYATELKSARTELQKLIDKEKERTNKNLSAFQDQTRLAQALRDARKEAKEGADMLDLSSKAGLENRDSLAALADAWNSSVDSVKNSKGAYREMRQNFIDVATEMGASRKEARRLADELLGVPKKASLKFQSEGFKERMAEIRALRREAKALSEFLVSLQFQRGQNKPIPGGTQAYATGGLIGGTGTGTSDSNLIWASRGEFMQRKAAVDYYGADFMRRLNALQIPKYATGGPIGAVQTITTTPTGQEIAGTLRIVDGVAYIEGVARAAADHDAKRQRLTSLDGIRR